MLYGGLVSDKTALIWIGRKKEKKKKTKTATAARWGIVGEQLSREAWIPKVLQVQNHQACVSGYWKVGGAWRVSEFKSHNRLEIWCWRKFRNDPAQASRFSKSLGGQKTKSANVKAHQVHPKL